MSDMTSFQLLLGWKLIVLIYNNTDNLQLHLLHAQSAALLNLKVVDSSLINEKHIFPLVCSALYPSTVLVSVVL